MSEARIWVPVKCFHETLALFLAWASRPRPGVGQNWGATSPGGLTLSLYPLSSIARDGLGWVNLLGCTGWPSLLPLPTPPYPSSPGPSLRASGSEGGAVL